MAQATLVDGVLKSLVKRQRPVPEFDRPHHLRIPLTTSFPSGHASAAFCAAGLLSDGSRCGPAYYGLATVVAASRVHVKIHHASDIIVGAAVGATVAEVAKRIWRLPRR
jgi:undecaprenyl-diphosphatase